MSQKKQNSFKKYFTCLTFALMMPLFAGCTKALQTGVFVPDVERKESGHKCYAPHGIKLVHWANLIEAQEKQKPFIQGMQLDDATGQSVIYGNIPEGEMYQKDPMYPKNSGIPYLGLQNIISLPVTAITASFKTSSVRKAQKTCEAMTESEAQAYWEKEQLVRSQMQASKQQIQEIKYEQLKTGDSPAYAD